MSIKNKKCPVRKCPWGTQLNDELTFLIACCQTDPSKDDIKFIHNYLNDPHLDINTLIALANQHGILPLIYKSLKKLLQSNSILDTNHSTLLADFKTAYTQIAQRNILMSAELIRIMKLLERNNIKALAFKGPTLSQIAYGDITLRQFGDLDILIKKENLNEIDLILKKSNYQRVLQLTKKEEALWIKYAHDIGFYHPNKNIMLELHWKMMLEQHPIQLNNINFFDKIQQIELNRNLIATFSTENLLIYLCIHGSKHLYERLEWVIDIDRLIRNNKVDWNIMNSLTNDRNYSKMLYLGLEISYSLFMTPLPQNIIKKYLKNNEILEISRQIKNSWNNPVHSTFSFKFNQTIMLYKLLISLQDKLKFLHLLFRPSFNEFSFINLPKTFHFLYYFIRPFLQIKKYFSK